MIFETRANPPLYKNGFLLVCERTNEAVLIDPGEEVADLLDAVTVHSARVRYILLTHAHFDHVSGVAAAKEALAVPVYLHKEDNVLYDHAAHQAALFGMTIQQPPPVDAFYDGSPILFGDYRVTIHHTPGHCPGGVCLQVGGQGAQGEHLFVGDTLFAGSIGRTDLPGGDYQVLMRSIVDVLFALGDEAVVHPGHGPDTTIARERTSNPFVLEYLAARGRGRGR